MYGSLGELSPWAAENSTEYGALAHKFRIKALSLHPLVLRVKAKVQFSTRIYPQYRVLTSQDDYRLILSCFISNNLSAPMSRIFLTERSYSEYAEEEIQPNPEYPSARKTGFATLRNLVSSCEIFLDRDGTDAKLAQYTSLMAYDLEDTQFIHYLQKVLDAEQLWARVPRI